MAPAVRAEIKTSGETFLARSARRAVSSWARMVVTPEIASTRPISGFEQELDSRKNPANELIGQTAIQKKPLRTVYFVFLR